MTASPLSSVLFGELLSDPEIAAEFEDRARLKWMLAVEAALAHAQGRLGIIPDGAGERIAKAAKGLDPDPASLAAQTTRDGVPVPALVTALRKACAPGDRDYVHWGATSQDIVDTAFMLSTRGVLAVLERRLVAFLGTLGKLAGHHRRTLMPGRTRFQPAVPVTFGAKVAGWAAPLLRDLERLQQLRPRVLVVSFAGAAGTHAMFGKKGTAIEAALAGELGLAVPIGPWHTARDSMAELATWLSLVTGTLGKIGVDVLMLAQAEVAEVHIPAAGGSSAMPHKNNPVAAEILVALARFNADRVGSLHQAMIDVHERDGSAWTLEWLTLPEMMVAAGAALNKARALIDGLAVNEGTMRDHVMGPPALLLSESALHALAEHMPKSEAERLVKTAIERAAKTGEHLIDVMTRLTDASADWTAIREAKVAIEAAEALVDRVIAALPR